MAVDESISIQPRDARNFAELGRILRRGPAKIVGPGGEQAVLPKALYSLLKDLVDKLAEGDSLVVLPETKQLTTQQAAELLGISRPFLIRLLEGGEMPYSMVGKHRRIELRDVLAYSDRRAKARRSALDKMARQAYRAGLYDNARIPKGGRDE